MAKGYCIKHAKSGRCLKRRKRGGAAGPACQYGVVRRGHRKGQCLKNKRARRR
jgi:hypothetical protein